MRVAREGRKGLGWAFVFDYGFGQWFGIGEFQEFKVGEAGVPCEFRIEVVWFRTF